MSGTSTAPAELEREATIGTILVTGGSGFIGSHCILQLLARGPSGAHHRAQPGSARATCAPCSKEGGAEPGDRLSFVAADLAHDAGWAEAVAGCEYVLHVASPFPPNIPKHEDELIVPAREGALRVLRAARDAGVKRVVLTSSFAAIGYGHPPRTRRSTKPTGPNADAAGLSAYVKSKTLAERAAWDFIAREGGDLELSVVNPVVRVRPGPRAGLFDVDPAGQAPDGRRHARLFPGSPSASSMCATSPTCTFAP